MWATRRVPSAAARSAVQGVSAAAQSTTSRAVRRETLCNGSRGLAMTAVYPRVKVATSSHGHLRRYHGATGPMTPTQAALAKKKSTSPAEDLEVYDQVPEDELEEEDLFSGSTTDVGSSSTETGIERKGESSQRSFRENVEAMRTSLEAFGNRKTQENPSLSLMRTILTSASNLEELRTAIEVAQVYSELWYYRYRSYRRITGKTSSLLANTANRLQYPEIALNAIAHSLDTGLAYDLNTLLRLQHGLYQKLCACLPSGGNDQTHKDLLLESASLEGAPQPTREWNGVPAAKDAAPTSGEAEAVAEGEGASAESAVPETASAVSDQAEIALDRAKLTLIDRMMIVTSMSAMQSTDQKSVDYYLAAVTLAAIARAFPLDSSAIKAIDRLQVFPRIENIIRQLALQQRAPPPSIEALQEAVPLYNGMSSEFTKSVVESTLQYARARQDLEAGGEPYKLRLDRAALQQKVIGRLAGWITSDSADQAREGMMAVMEQESASIRLSASDSHLGVANT